MRIGLIGSDSEARLRAECYARLPDVEVSGIVAGAESDPEWTRATVHSDVESLLADDVTAVDVRDRSRSLLPLVERALDAGIDAVCPTPLGRSPEEAAAIRDLADESDRTVLVDCPHRFDRENRAAKSLLDGGDIGTPTTVHTTRRIPAVDAFESGSALDPDRLLPRALYPDVARVRWLFDDVDRVFTRLRRGSGSNGDYCQAVTLVRFSSGVVGHLTVSYGDRHDEVSVNVEYSGTEGRFTYDSEEFTALSIRSRDEVQTGVELPFERSRPSVETHLRHVERLVSALRAADEPAESLSEASETLRVVHAASESARIESPVAVSEVAR